MKKYLYPILAFVFFIVLIAGLLYSSWDKWAAEFANMSTKEIKGIVITVIGGIGFTLFFVISLLRDD